LIFYFSSAEKKLGHIPFSTALAAQLASCNDPSVIATAQEIMLQQTADSTMSNALNHFVKWKNFAEQRQWPVRPPEEDDPIFDARFDMFVIDQYNKHKNRTLISGKKLPNKPEAFKAVFSGINNIASTLFDSPRIQTPLLKKARRSYTRVYPGNTLKKKLFHWSSTPSKIWQIWRV
jgi:hypothetical protein